MEVEEPDLVCMKGMLGGLERSAEDIAESRGSPRGESRRFSLSA